ncbi:hypothetical protein HK096_004399 [Nowakowskiella sp. JEL0078]|nr:hypothetical protein HK096_004399 [Nowakowskiella sp. JEL0078]
MSDFTVIFYPLKNTFKQKRTVNLENVVQIGRQLDSSEPSFSSLKFTSKVVSRQHAVIYVRENKVYLQDTKSSSGTFVNDERISFHGQESDPQEIKNGDIISLGEDCEVQGVVHLAVSMRISLPPFLISECVESTQEEFSDYSTDAQVRANVDSEFTSIWNSLTQGIDDPLMLLRSLKAKNTDTVYRQDIKTDESVIKKTSVTST